MEKQRIFDMMCQKEPQTWLWNQITIYANAPTSSVLKFKRKESVDRAECAPGGVDGVVSHMKWIQTTF